MPHNIYLHSALVQSRREYTKGSDTAKREAVFYFGFESALSLMVGCLHDSQVAAIVFYYIIHISHLTYPILFSYYDL